MTTDAISPDLKTVLRRLKLGRMLDTLPERLVLARQQKMPHQDLLTLVLSDEASRRDSLAVALRVQRGHLDPALQLDAWDPTAKVTFDRALLNELTTLRFLEAPRTSPWSAQSASARRFSPMPSDTSHAAAVDRCSRSVPTTC